MTVQEIIEQVYETMGDHTELDPYNSTTEDFDITTTGAQRILERLNIAYKGICNWKYKDKQNIKFDTLKAVKFFQSSVLSGTSDSGGSSTITFPSAGFGANAEQYTGWIIKITSGTGSGQSRLIVTYSTGRIATVHKAWDTTPDSTSVFSIYHREYIFAGSGSIYEEEHIALDPVTEIQSVITIYDIEESQRLTRGSRSDGWIDSIIELGNPLEYLRDGNLIMFDKAPDTSKWFKLEYYKQPGVLTAAADIPNIPVNFHFALILYTLWMLYIWNQENDSAWARKNDLIDEMEREKTSTDTTNDREEIGFDTGDYYGR